MEIITNHLVEIFFGLVSAGALAFCKYLWGQNKKLQEMQKADQNRQYRQMILDEIEPIIEELTKLKAEMVSIENSFNQKLAQAELDAGVDHQKMYDDLNKIQDANRQNFDMIINSYKFRLVQLCKSHLKDGYITEDEFEQIGEMYKIYSGMGGNGLAEDYYKKVIALDIKKDTIE